MNESRSGVWSANGDEHEMIMKPAETMGGYMFERGWERVTAV